MLTVVLAVSLSALAGLIIQRGGVCSVRAVKMLFKKRDTALFVGFAEAAAWATGVLLLAHFFTGEAFTRVTGAPIAWGGFLGGVLFGTGAAINQGCAFGTVAWIGRGHLHYLFMIPGFVAGAALLDAVRPDWRATEFLVNPPVAQSPWTLVAAVVVTGLALWRLITLVRWLRFSRVGLKEWIGGSWPVPLAMAAIGLLNGLMLLILAEWPYTRLLIDVVTGEGREILLRTMLAVALFGSAAFTGWVFGEFERRRLRLKSTLFSLIGGAFMGAGSQMIPGGNDSLLMRNMPALWPDAWLNYAALLVGILVSLHMISLVKSR